MWGDRNELMETLAEMKAARERGMEWVICGLCNGNGCYFCQNKGEVLREVAP